ncbi:MAG TPA: cytochrome c biogenesis protein CcdA [Pyrinomonadaceae bacterium]|mgnify:CR=1 FL=1|nr:cytochrome c biogenesis protein CcdA [Pyrinomonadaceae bacterium]
MFRALPKFIIIVAIFAISVAAQNPVKWSLETTPTGDLAAGAKLKATIKAEIEAPWKLYSIDQPAGGPFATTIKVAENSPFTIDGKITTPKPIVKEDPNFIIDDKPLMTRSFAEKAEFYVPVSISRAGISTELLLDVRFQVCTETTCLPPKTVRVSTSGFEDQKRTVANTAPSASQATPVISSTQSTDIWAFIWLAITFGAISLLTPCVFPMIPITVSYFMKHSDGDRARTIKLATVYSVGIIATFSLLGMLLAVAFGAAGINLFAANPWVNIGIAAIFLFFAFNLFGFYEITIPSSVLSKLDKITRAEEGKGSAYIGALLMGLTFTLTSFTCTSPFIGTILVSTAQGDWKMPLLGMLIFSTVFALPFFVLATVPRLLSSLPKSGGWLNSVKVVMGFLEIAAALKFLSNVDLVWSSAFKTGTSLNYGLIFTREVVLIIWVMIGLGICAYILGFFKFRHDSPLKKLSALRVFFAALFLGLCIYLTTGVLGRKLGELESFLPPKNRESRFNVLGNKEAELHWLHNDYAAALAQAKAENKSVFIDFTGYTCTNCRWMEANMFPLSEVKAEMEKYVLVGLYTDGDGEVYERQQQFQQDTFQTVALPFYAVVNADGVPVATFPGLTRNPQEFIDFLQKANKN